MDHVAVSYESQRKAHDPEYRERKRVQNRAAQARRRQRHRKIKHLALDRPCVDCGIELPPEIMEFDHVCGEKLFNICQSYGTNLYVSDKMLYTEIAKCDVRCPNCHRFRHLKESRNE